MRRHPRSGMLGHAIRVAMVVGFLGGCAGKLPPPDPRVGPVRLVHGGTDPGVQKLLDTVYSGSFDVGGARALAREVLRAAPDSGAAHEAAAYLAGLADDLHESWFHFWKAAQDLDASATAVYLWEMNVDPTRREREASLALYEALRAQHPDPAVRVAASIWEARTLKRLGRFHEVAAIIEPLGLMRDFQLIGPFDNEAGKGFLTVFPPEKAIDLSATVAGPLVPLSWRSPPPTDLDIVPIDHMVWPSNAGVAYLATWVRADREVDAQLRLSASDPARAWVNGGLVMSEEHVSDADFDNLIVPVHLQRGWNQVLLKSAHTDGSWWLTARLSDRNGAALAGLTTSRLPQPFVPQPDSLTPAETHPAELAGILPEGRRKLLLGSWLTRGGNYPAALEELRSFLTAAPSNLLATYFVALAHWNNEEAGKAIDLLNDGVARAAEAAPAFLHLRARYYLQRQLYDKAQADYLRELAITAAAREAEKDFADLLSERGWRAERCRQLEVSARRWPDSVTMERDLGQCQIALGYGGQGNATLERARELEPGAWTVVEQLFDQALDEGRFSDARRWIEALETIDPTWPGYVVDEAELARRQGRRGEAEQRLRTAIRMNEQWPRPHDRLGSLLWEEGRSDEALAEWKLALERNPNDTVLAQRIEFHQPTHLGFIEAYIPTAEDLDGALRKKVTPAFGAQRAWLLDHEVTEINADGSARRVVTQITQALDEHGRDALISQRIPTLAKILQAYSISKGGERLEASSIRGGELRFRNLEVGSRVVVQYIHYLPTGDFLENHYASSWSFRSTDAQVEESRWVLVLPQGRLLRTHVEGPVHTEEKSIEGRRVYTFWMQNVPPLVGEPSSPPLADLIWRVDVSTLPDWDEYVRWERALLTDAFRGSPQLDELSDRETRGATTPLEKLDRLARYVMKEIRYQQDYENTIAGVRPHAGPVVLERGYGDCKDKATLLIQLAKRAGIKLRFAILRTVNAGKMVREVPNQQFNHAIVYAPVQPGIATAFFLDPTPDALDLGNLPGADQGATSLVLDPDTGAWEMIPIPYDAAERSFAHIKLAVEIKSPSEAKATGTLVTQGPAGLAIRHVLRNKSISDKFFQTLAGQLLQSAMLVKVKPPDEEDIGKPVTIEIELDASRAIQERDGDYRLPLPWINELQSKVGLDHRAMPLLLGVSAESEMTVEVKLPDGYVPKHVPTDFAITAPCFEIRRHALVKGRTVSVVGVMRNTCHEVAVADYEVFRDKIRDALGRLRDEVSFGKAPPVVAGRKR